MQTAQVWLLQFLTERKREGFWDAVGTTDETGIDTACRRMLFQFYVWKWERVGALEGKRPSSEASTYGKGRELASNLRAALAEYYRQLPSKADDPLEISVGVGAEIYELKIAPRNITRRRDRRKGIERRERHRPHDHRRGSETLLTSFWAPHLKPGALTHVAFGAPAFLEAESPFGLRYTRHSLLNTRKQVEAEFTERVCRPFVALGDAMCALNLTQWLSLHGVRVTFNWYKAEADLARLEEHLQKEAHDAAVVVLGSSRLNGLIKEYHDHPFADGTGAFPFHSDDRGVFELSRGGKTISRWDEARQRRRHDCSRACESTRR